MVKHILFSAVLIFVTACGDNPENHYSTDKAFDSNWYSKSSFFNRVEEFLSEREETAAFDSYQAIFVNTAGCTACVKGFFTECSEFLKKTNRKTLIYINDPSLLKLGPDNPEVDFILLPEKDFKKENVFHSESYLYLVDKNSFKAIHLDEKVNDSLNSL